MPVFEVESWKVKQGKEKEHGEWMRRWLQWVNDNRDLFPEWESVRYYIKHFAGPDSGYHFIVWEYENLAAYEQYKARRAGYTGPYEEYKKNDPYYAGVFDPSSMRMEVWRDLERDLWIE